jgi:hypothetical protein
MKTMVLTLMAVLGIALSPTTLIPAAHAALVSTNLPIDTPGWG